MITSHLIKNIISNIISNDKIIWTRIREGVWEYCSGGFKNVFLFINVLK
jgi:hypothetical protein